MVYRLLLGINLFLLNIRTIHSLRNITWKDPPILWPEAPSKLEQFYDRVVSINLDLGDENHKIIATGVMITGQHVLTSYNPFRSLVRDKSKRKVIVVGALEYRGHLAVFAFNLSYALIECGRQVIPVPDKDIKEDDWHGRDHLHSPLHDLFVMRMDRNFTLQNNNKKLNSKFTFDRHQWSLAGPLLTNVAEPDEPLGREIEIASIGNVEGLYIANNISLYAHTWDPEENVEANCDEWIPRQWGHFICLRNVNDFEAIASGSVLVYNSKIYGIGSFALWKGKKSILVFTDVRPYYSLINETCTVDDQIS